MTVTGELTALDSAIDRGTERLFELQRPEGFWVGELESNVTMTSQHLFWNHFLGLRTPALDRRIAAELLARQRDDGTWAIWWDGPADLSTTIEAYVALKLAGADPGLQARAFIQSRGGIPKSRVFTKCFLALLGHWPWQRIPSIPPELVLLPPSSPFSVYTFACWARQTVVALSAVTALRPVRPAPIDLREIGSVPGATRPPRRPGPRRRRALAAAERWLRERQEADGSWGGIQPPWVWAIVLLASLGHGFEDEALRRAVEGWGGFMVDDGTRLRPEACQSPVWDTALALLALGACGVGAEDPRVASAVEWLLNEEIRISGDWAVRRPGLRPGGWAFEYQNDLYPDIDDTGVIAVALRKLDVGGPAVRRGLDWVAGMQSRNGGWGAFDADGQALWWIYRIPFCDFGRVTDEPSADVTAHVLEALGPDGSYPQETERGVRWLLREQEPDGSWYGRWGVNHVYGTGAALPALEACGVAATDASMRRAVSWLDSVQRPDGGFGEDIRSYADRSLRGRAAFATPSQTAWALTGYVAAGEATGAAARRAAEFLWSSQRDDGDWDEDHFTGTGFPLDFMIRYHLYRLNFPLLALGRLRERLNG